MLADPAARARLSLDGVSVGDCFGQQFFLDEDAARDLIESRTPPAGPWPYTDDTLMAAGVCGVLLRHAHVDQDALAAAFAAGYSFDRGYGPAMHRQLMRVAAGEHWDAVARGQFGGMGSFGNGAAMRAAPVGAYFAGDPDRVVGGAVGGRDAHAPGRRRQGGRGGRRRGAGVRPGGPRRVAG